mgnify:CR=1 FL=1
MNQVESQHQDYRPRSVCSQIGGYLVETNKRPIPDDPASKTSPEPDQRADTEMSISVEADEDMVVDLGDLPNPLCTLWIPDKPSVCPRGLAGDSRRKRVGS